MTFDAICRRAGGRRHYNKMRQSDVFWRLVELEAIFRSEGYQPGDYARWAARLGVSRSTICRDVRRLWNAHGSALVALAQMHQDPNECGVMGCSGKTKPLEQTVLEASV